MSKIGKKPILIPESVSVEEQNGFLKFEKDEKIMEVKILPYVKAEIKEGEIDGRKQKTLFFSIENNIKQARANWGTLRALAQNAIEGLQSGFKKVLEIEGIGYRAQMEGENLVLNIGYSHPVKYSPVKGIKISVEKNQIIISGADKISVGQTAAEIRKMKKPEPYKGKGIRYQGEFIKKKVGKKMGAIK